MNSRISKVFLKTLIWIFAISFSVYLILCINVFFLQDRMVYHPTSELIATPANWGIPYEEVTFKADDGVRLHGWFLPGTSDGPVVLFCHGNAGNISGREIMLSNFHELGASVFIFDYRGFGKSEGNPSEQGTVLDAVAAWQMLTEKKQIPPEQIVLFGRSLGGGVAAHLASRLDANATFRGLVLMSTFTSLPSVGQAAYPFLPIRLLSKYEYPTQQIIASLTKPVLIFHGPNDETIPYSHGRALYNSAREPKTFVSMGGGHNDAVVVSRDKIKTALSSFFNQLK